MTPNLYPSWAIPALLAALAGLAAPVGAQESTSINTDGNGGLPGDALSPFAAGIGQRASFIVDLSPLTTSSGAAFGIAPVIKSGKTSTVRFNALNGTSVVSADIRTGTAYPATQYTYWHNARGGINPTENSASLNTTITPTGPATVMGIGVMDFDDLVVGTSSVFTNQLYAGLIAFDPANPSRLFVTRINAATNSTLNSTDRSQFGMGAIDADGNLCFRADSFGAVGAAISLLQGDNYFRIKSTLRGTTVNLIDNNGGSNTAATDWPLQRSTAVHTVPTAIPARIAGRSVIIGSDLLGNDRYEAAANTLSGTSTAHRPATQDQRGAPSFTARALFPASVGTAAILTRTTSGGSGRTDTLSVWGVDINGNPTTARSLPVPASLSDPCIGYTWNLSGGDFRGFESQAIFRGGAGPVAITQDQAGRALVASVVYSGSIPGSANPLDAIAVARFDPANPNSPSTWITAAWVDPNLSSGKALFGDFGRDGAPGTGDQGEGDGIVNTNDAPIGRLAALTENPFATPGPSLSSPAFDAAGNLYFLASVSLKKRVGAQVIDVPGTALIRGLYNPASFCYTLEEVMEIGSVFTGANSRVPWQVQGLNLADLDSAATPSTWSSSTTQLAWNNLDSTTLASTDTRQLGGLVLSARICYDVDGDGIFEDPTIPGNNDASPDEAYNVVLYIGNTQPATTCGTADFNNDGDVGTDQDIEAFFRCLAGNCCPACQGSDFDGDGDIGTDRDIEAFFRVLAGGQC